MNILVTGASGFVGGNLVRMLKANASNTVVQTSRGNKDNFVKFDPKIYGGFDLSKFDLIYHLSSQASVHISFEKPFDTVEDNVFSVLNLVRMVHETGKRPKVIVASSAEIYRPSMIALTEQDPLLPRSPYGISKQVADLYMQGMAKCLNMNLSILRTFNITGPGQATKFALSSFAKQIIEIEKEKKAPKISVGNLGVCRDFLDVRDGVRAYELVANSDEKGEVYNVCSGNQYVLKDLLNRLIKLAGFEVEIEVDKSKLRPVDVPVYVGDNEKFRKRFGWKPEYSIDDTLKSLLEYWRLELK